MEFPIDVEALTPGEWHHIAVRVSADGVKVCINKTAE